MIRLLFWVAVYVFFIGVVSFRVSHRDGLIIVLTGWPELLARRRAKKGGRQYNELIKAYNDAVARIAELQKDRERLDWLESHQPLCFDAEEYVDGKIGLQINQSEYIGETFRQAIDNARE